MRPHHILLGTLAALCAVLWARTSSYQAELLAVILTYAVAALAQNLLSGYSDIPSLGNVAFFAAGAFTAAWVTTLAHASGLVSALAGVLAAGLLGLVVGLPALRLSGMHLAIMTVALVFAGQDFMTQWYQAHGTGYVSLTPPTWLQGRGLLGLALATCALTYLAIWNLLQGRTGRAIQALSARPLAAAACGIAPVRYRLGIFTLSAALTGLAGVVYAYYLQNVTAGTFTLDLSLGFLTMMIVGGTRSLAGSFVGACIIGFLPQLFDRVPAQIGQLQVHDAEPAVYALLLLVTLRYFPEGVWNGFSRRWRDLRFPRYPHS